VWAFKAPIPASEEAFLALLERFDAGDETVFEASPAVSAFLDELLTRHPPLEQLPEDKIDESVWSMTPARSDRLLTLDCVWPEAERMAEEILQLARKHGLALMDPQSGQVVRP
jgi:hypothetical protein